MILEMNLILQDFYFTIAFIILAVVLLISYILYLILRNPFEYPYFAFTFDVTSKRNIRHEDYIDNFLRSPKNYQTLQEHQNYILQWKSQTENKIKTGALKNYRMKQYEKTLDDQHAFIFLFVRKRTRYQQQNYIKYSYKVAVNDSEMTVNWFYLSDRYEKLKSIGFESTINEYNSKNQRKLMTPQLRKDIMERDNYTCQICGKYMPDEVGLHIDHISPIAKGGKTIPSNLRVLCSKCNGKKGAK